MTFSSTRDHRKPS